ncbi:hypothetical protein PAXRUDRAFT_16041 [Paxillus rubicundulus Ve08.2h10]|uniref:Uncharacterized protein n=1 Tax=Paxillus rubicundulus Ve08.2h10 TaxID=930991 RepID=A0A0D0CWR7_9AGAM|nr:hypothetical protein PAXRUDRAFT_16041 [Paxillus rubicundulus Ve08.2h10]
MAWEEDDNEVIATIKSKLAEPKPSDDDCKDLTDEEILKAQEHLLSLFSLIFSELSQLCGWSFTVLMGGPDPSQDGEISVLFWDIGTTDLGHYFTQYTKDFQSTFLDPYSAFCSNGKSIKHEGSKDEELDEPETNDSSVDGNLSDTCQPSVSDVEAILGGNEVNKEEPHRSQDMDKDVIQKVSKAFDAPKVHSGAVKDTCSRDKATPKAPKGGSEAGILWVQEQVDVVGGMVTSAANTDAAGICCPPKNININALAGLPARKSSCASIPLTCNAIGGIMKENESSGTGSGRKRARETTTPAQQKKAHHV